MVHNKTPKFTPAAKSAASAGHTTLHFSPQLRALCARVLKKLSEIEEEVLLSGTWLYDGTVENEVHIIKTNFKPGSGDYEDEPYVRNDQFGTFYGVRIGQYNGEKVF